MICVRNAHYRKINAIVVFDDGALCATAGDDALVRVWSLLRWERGREGREEGMQSGVVLSLPISTCSF